MGLWNRLKRLFGFGSDEQRESDATTAEPEPSETTDAESTAPEPGVCTICGTDVDPGTASCPLCGSSDLAFGEEDVDIEEDGPAPTTTRSASDDDAVAKLKQLRQRDDE